MPSSDIVPAGELRLPERVEATAQTKLGRYNATMSSITPRPDDGPFPMMGVNFKAIDALPPLEIPTVEECGFQSLTAIHTSDLKVGDVVLIGTIDQCMFDPDETTGQYGLIPRAYGFKVLSVEPPGKKDYGNPQVLVEMIDHPRLRSHFLDACPTRKAYFAFPMIFKGRPLSLSSEVDRHHMPTTAQVQAIFLSKTFQSVQIIDDARERALAVPSALDELPLDEIIAKIRREGVSMRPVLRFPTIEAVKVSLLERLNLGDLTKADLEHALHTLPEITRLSRGELQEEVVRFLIMNGRVDLRNLR
ncbi:MAG: hypothetical protein WCT36_04960 [Candidatus Gracilibacteria bacterium]|jgi:hypothetical protein